MGIARKMKTTYRRPTPKENSEYVNGIEHLENKARRQKEKSKSKDIESDSRHEIFAVTRANTKP